MDVTFRFYYFQRCSLFYTLKCSILKICLQVVLFPITYNIISEIHLSCRDWGLIGVNQISDFKLLSRRPGLTVELFSKCDPEQVRGFRDMLPSGVRWTVQALQHHLPFSSTSSPLIRLLSSDISLCCNVPGAFTLLYTRVLSQLFFSLLLSLLSALG